MKKPIGAIALVPHNPKKFKRFPWFVCEGCGLVYLKNPATRKAISQGHWKYEDE